MILFSKLCQNPKSEDNDDLKNKSTQMKQSKIMTKVIFSIVNKYETLNKLSRKLKKRKMIEFKCSDLLSMLVCK